jgi:hypothetical protein
MMKILSALWTPAAPVSPLGMFRAGHSVRAVAYACMREGDAWPALVVAVEDAIRGELAALEDERDELRKKIAALEAGR